MEKVFQRSFKPSHDPTTVDTHCGFGRRKCYYCSQIPSSQNTEGYRLWWNL